MGARSSSTHFMDNREYSQLPNGSPCAAFNRRYLDGSFDFGRACMDKSINIAGRTRKADTDNIYDYKLVHLDTTPQKQHSWILSKEFRLG